MSADFGGGDTRSCQDQVDGFGGWACNIDISGVPDGTYPVDVYATGGPASGVVTTGTLTIAPYAVPVPTITSPEASSHLTTQGAVVIGGAYDFNSLDDGAGGFVTVTVDSPSGTTQHCSTDFYPYTETSWSCEIYPEYGMNSVTAVVTEGAMSGRSSAASAIYVVGRGTEGAPTLATPADGTVVASGVPVGFSGTGPVISLPVVELRDYPGGSGFYPWCYGPVIGATGDWTCSTNLNAGEYEVRVSTEDVNGVTTTSTPIRVTAAIGITLTGAPGTVVWGSGTYQPSGTTTNTVDTLTLLLDGAVVGDCEFVVPNPDGTWQCPTPLPYPLPGHHDVGVIQSEGSSGSVEFDVLIPAPDFPFFYEIEADSIFNFGGGTVHAEGTVYVEIQETGDSCEAVVDELSGMWGGCFIDFSGYVPGDVFTVEYWQDSELANGVHSTWEFGIYEPGGGEEPIEPSVTCHFAPGEVTLSVAEGEGGVELYGPIIQGGEEPMGPANPGHCNGYTGTLVTEVASWGPMLTSCDDSCGATGLTPGVYNVFSWGAGEGGSDFDYFFTVPEPPTIDSITRSGATTTVTGTSLGNHDVGLVDGVNGLCFTTANAAGGWTCSFDAATGTSVRAAQVDPGSGGVSPLTAAVTVPEAPATPTTPTPTPTPNPTRVPWTWDFSFDGNGQYRPGDTVSFSGSGVPAGTTLVVELHSTVRTLGSTTAAADGTFTFTATIPADIEPGAHHVVVIATAPGEEPATLERAIDILELPLPAATEDEPEAEPGDEVLAESGSGSGSGSGARNEPAAPTALSSALPTLSRIVDDPFVLLTAGGLGLALLFLVAIPAELLNSTISSNTRRFGRGFRAIESFSDRIRDWFISVTRSRAAAAAILVVVVSTIFGFVDPGFGFDLASLRLVLSLSIAFFVLSYGTSWLTGIILRRTAHADSQIVIQPATILFAVLGVVLARLLDFAPGFLIGLVIGLELTRAARRTAATAVLVQFGLILGLSVAAWVGYSLIAESGGAVDFGGALLNDTLVALTAEGLMAIFVAALPLTFLEGRDLWEHSKPIWFITFFVIASAFALIVLPTALSGTDGADLGVWVLVFAGFGVVTFILWAVFAAISRRENARERSGGARERRCLTPFMSLSYRRPGAPRRAAGSLIRCQRVLQPPTATGDSARVRSTRATSPTR